MKGTTHEPDSHVSCDLVVTGTTSVELSTDSCSDDFRETTLVGGMNIFIIREDFELRGSE